MSQNAPLRGHRDDGKINTDKSYENKGLLKAVLNYRSRGDEVLRDHLRNCGENSQYTSPKIQNKIIMCAAKLIQTKIVQQIKDSKFFSIIFDETTDIFRIEQIAIVIRYMHNFKIQEAFIGYVDCYAELNDDDIKLSGINLGKIVLKQINDLGLNIKHLTSVGTDAPNFMTSMSVGARNEIIKASDFGVHSLCLGHLINNCSNFACRNPHFNMAISTIKDIVSFFNQSAKRLEHFKRNSDVSLSKLCETRWVAKSKSITKFKNAMVGLPKNFQNLG